MCEIVVVEGNELGFCIFTCLKWVKKKTKKHDLCERMKRVFKSMFKREIMLAAAQFTSSSFNDGFRAVSVKVGNLARTFSINSI